MGEKNLLFFIDAKLDKKCTLLDLSRRPSVASLEAQGMSSETKSQDSPSLPKPTTDHGMSDFCSNEKMEVEKKEEEKEITEKLSTEESAAKMEVDPTDSQSEEGQSKYLVF